jgi:hypothetical protein
MTLLPQAGVASFGLGDASRHCVVAVRDLSACAWTVNLLVISASSNLGNNDVCHLTLTDGSVENQHRFMDYRANPTS